MPGGLNLMPLTSHKRYFALPWLKANTLPIPPKPSNLKLTAPTSSCVAPTANMDAYDACSQYFLYAFRGLTCMQATLATLAWLRPTWLSTSSTAAPTHLGQQHNPTHLFQSRFDSAKVGVSTWFHSSDRERLYLNASLRYVWLEAGSVGRAQTK